MLARFALGLILSHAPVVVIAPNTYHPTNAIWGAAKRCDMLEHASAIDITKGGFTTAGGWRYPYPSYTVGAWVPAATSHPAVTSFLPMACDTQDMCPLQTPGCESTTPAKLTCKQTHVPCFSDRRAAHFEHVLHGLAWTWQPHDGCRFSPPATSVDKWFAWSAAREADAGPMLFVGDLALASLFMAFQQFTSGAQHSDYLRADTVRCRDLSRRT